MKRYCDRIVINLKDCSLKREWEEFAMYFRTYEDALRYCLTVAKVVSSLKPSIEFIRMIEEIMRRNRHILPDERI